MNIIISDGNGGIFWDQHTDVVPRKGETIIFRDPQNGSITKTAIVKEVCWWLDEGGPRAQVQIFVDLVD